MTTQEQRITKAKQSCAFTPEELIGAVVSKDLFDGVAQGIAKNVKMGPFKATSGLVIPYYLNASTNFMDKFVAPLILEEFGAIIEKKIIPSLPQNVTSANERLLCVGMEVAGGVCISQFNFTFKMLVSQLAAANKSALNKLVDYCYVRKSRKSTGTQQQLEGPQEFTSRTKDSPVLYAIWLDDALSTGTSLLEGIEMLKQDYNIQVVAALYLVDRSVDRANLKEQKLANPVFDNVQLFAAYDLAFIDAVCGAK